MTPSPRRIPRLRDLSPFMHVDLPSLSATTRRLDRAYTIYDLRTIAQRRVPRVAFDYADGGAEAEITLRRSREAFEDIEFVPSILASQAEAGIDTSVQILGGPSVLPFGIAPTGFTRMLHTEGELVGAAAARDAGIPFSLSTMGTRSIEEVREVNPDGRTWFQLYLWKDHERGARLIERAAAAGYDTLLVTVDVPVGGARLHDSRNGMRSSTRGGRTTLFSLRPATVANAIPHPGWWFDFLTTEPLSFASMASGSDTVGALMDSMFDPTVSYDDLRWVRSIWPHPTLTRRGRGPRA